MAVAEVPEPYWQIGRQILDHLSDSDATGSPRLFQNSLIQASNCLGGDPLPRFSSDGKAEFRKLPLPWMNHGPLRLIYLELEALRNEVNENPKRAEETLSDDTKTAHVIGQSYMPPLGDIPLE